MGVLSRGATFTDGGDVSPSDLQGLVENATLGGVTRAQIDQSARALLTRANEEPAAPYEGELFEEQNASNPYLAVYDGSNFVAGSLDVLRVRNVSGSTLEKGDAVRYSSASDPDNIIVAIHLAASEQNFIGICLTDFEDGGYGYIQISGLCEAVKVNGAVSDGDGLGGKASTNGVFESKGARTGFDVHAIARTDNLSGDGTVKAWILD